MKTNGLKFLLVAALGFVLNTNGFTQGGNENVPEECLKNYSLYYEFYKHKNYTDALVPWRELFKQCPEWKESTFAYGINIYRDFLDKEKDPVKIIAYTDTIMMIYDKRIEYFPASKGDVLGRKGIDLLRYRRNDGPEYIRQGFDILKESVAIEKEKSSPVVLTTQISAGISLYLNDLLDGEEVINAYVTATEILDAEMAKRPSAKTKQAREAIDANIKDSRVMTCEAISGIFGPKYEANQDNIEFLKLVSGFLNDAGDCEMDPLYAKVAEQLYSKEPSAEAAYNLGRLFMKKDQYEKSKTYFLEAVESAKDDASKANYYYTLAGLSQQYLNSPNDAVSYASQATQLRPEWGDPYILMGIAYISGNSSLGDDFERRTAYWIAVDMFQKARSADPSVADKASGLIREYSEYFPSKEDLFFRSIAEGDRYTVGGWINKSTLARPKN
ncbi:MAG: tetratricopeptide repeat protein [Bacteroidales bacterium]|nr:tetratricopeptide repeat protein [Bacteroidales bacterium]